MVRLERPCTRNATLVGCVRHDTPSVVHAHSTPGVAGSMALFSRMCVQGHIHDSIVDDALSVPKVLPLGYVRLLWVCGHRGNTRQVCELAAPRTISVLCLTTYPLYTGHWNESNNESKDIRSEDIFKAHSEELVTIYHFRGKVKIKNTGEILNECFNLSYSQCWTFIMDSYKIFLHF